MKLTLPKDWTFATGIKSEKGVYKCQGKKLEVSAGKMFQNKLFSVKVPAGTYDVELTNHNGEVWLVLIGAGSRRKKNIAVGVILSVLMQYKSHGVSLTKDDGSPVDESPNDEIHVLWGDGNTQAQTITQDIDRRGTRVHAWFSKKHAQITAPALYRSESGEPILVTSCSEDYERSKPSKLNTNFDDGVYRGIVFEYLGAERDYKTHTDYLWNLK